MLRQFTSTEILGKTEEEFIKNIASMFPSETALLSGETQTSPGITHDLVSDFKEEELPSSILSVNKLLPELKESYNRKNYVELNRGFTSAIALRQVLLGGEDNYKAFIRGQAVAVALTREQFEALHKEYNERLHHDNLKIAAIYMATFNDVGKAIKILNEASIIKNRKILDHDEANAIILGHPLKRAELLPGLERLDSKIRDLICHSVGLDFNPSCFTQGEYPLYPVTQIAEALKKVPDELRESIFSLIKIESAMDVAGVRGHQAPGGAAYIKFVHPAFDLAFNQLEALAQGKSAQQVYKSYLEQNAKKFGLNEIKDQDEQVTLTRIAMMIRANSAADGKLVIETFAKLKGSNPELAKTLIKELATNNINPEATSIWMQYSPDLLRILCKENKSGQTPIEGLHLGLQIFSQVLSKSRVSLPSVPCYMTQGREIIPTVRKAAGGDKNALLLLERAANGYIEITEGVVQFKQLQEVEEFKTDAAATKNDEVSSHSPLHTIAPIEQKSQPINYIIDTDIGGDIDDTLALFVAINSHSRPLAITTTHIEPEEKARIAKLILIERGYGNIPVYAGVGSTRKDSKQSYVEKYPLFPAAFGFPNPEVGEKLWYPKQAAAYSDSYGKSFNNVKVEDESAPKFIARIAKQYSPKNKLTIVTLGPLHNLEEALKIDPSIAENIKLVSMGGLYPKGYNWLISPATTSNVISKVETTVVTSDFIVKNGFVITPEELEDIVKNAQPKFGETVLSDWKNWLKADHFQKKNTHLYDPITVYLALHPEQITLKTPMKIAFPCLNKNLAGWCYNKPGLENQITSAEETKESQTRFVSQVKSPQFIRDQVHLSIRNTLTSPCLSLAKVKTPIFSKGKIAIFGTAALLGIGLFARAIGNRGGTATQGLNQNGPRSHL